MLNKEAWYHDIKIKRKLQKGVCIQRHKDIAEVKIVIRITVA